MKRTVRDISSLNIRVAHEVRGCAKSVLPHLMEGKTFLEHTFDLTTGSRKTTLLRDLIRELSSGGIMGSGDECVRGGRAFGDRSLFWQEFPSVTLAPGRM